MASRAAAGLCVALAAASVAAASAPRLDLRPPSPVQRSTARLVLTSDTLALWSATNARRELCIGWAVVSSAPPAHFACLRRGLERPLLTVETGGGFGGQATWGIIAGFASPAVARVSAETSYGARTTRHLVLRSVKALSGWRVFTTGVMDHPTSTTLEAYDSSGKPLLDGSGGTIHPSAPASGPTIAVPGGGTVPGAVAAPPPVTGQAPAPSGPAWADTEPTLGETPAAESAISIALGDSTVGSLAATHRTWVEGASTWFACSGRRLGAVLTFRFAKPVSFNATVPVVVRPSGKAAYAVSRRSVAVAGARELTVWVDAGVAQVVGIDAGYWPFVPGPGPVSAFGAAGPARDQGGPDTPDCWQTHD